MKLALSSILAILLATATSFGYIIEKPIDYARQMKSADFVGIVEVTKITETGNKKVLRDGGVAFRELRLELKVLSALKGNAKVLICNIYREPTREELIADGVAADKVFLVLLNLGTSEELHLFPARVVSRDLLLVYLRLVDRVHVPVSGELESSRSILRIEPSNIVNNLHRNSNKNAEQGGAGQPATAP